MIDIEPTQPKQFVTLYREALEEFGASALRSIKLVSDPTLADALAVAHSLRTKGNSQAQLLAQRIEQAVVTALSVTIAR